tara:strand:+ start:78 stop:479 length:402 start_codon:yes stop_codon:yes gene_type:complete
MIKEDVSSNNLEQSLKNECIICLDYINEDDLLQLEDIDKNIKSCGCKAALHNKCFNEWYIKKFSCPICSNELLVKDIDTESDDIECGTNVELINLTNLYNQHNNCENNKRYVVIVLILWAALMIILTVIDTVI